MVYDQSSLPCVQNYRTLAQNIGHYSDDRTLAWPCVFLGCLFCFFLRLPFFLFSDSTLPLTFLFGNDTILVFTPLDSGLPIDITPSDLFAEYWFFWRPSDSVVAIWLWCLFAEFCFISDWDWEVWSFKFGLSFKIFAANSVMPENCVGCVATRALRETRDLTGEQEIVYNIKGRRTTVSFYHCWKFLEIQINNF